MKHQLTVALLGLVASASAVAQDERDDQHHELEEIIVTATPLARTVEQLAQPTGVIAADELERKQAASIGETLANEPGVTATYFGPVASRPVIRGQFGERVRVLSNSLDALDASALSEDHAVSIDSLLAERIEVVRGPATLLYGSGAAGGLVNVVDSRVHAAPLPQTFSGALSIGTDSAIGRESAAVKFDLGNDDVVAHVDAFRRTTDDVEIPGFVESDRLRALEGEVDGQFNGESGLIENTSSETDGAAAGLTWFGSNGYLGIVASIFDSEYGVPGHHHEEEGEPAAGEEEAVRIALDQERIDLTGEWAFGGFIEAAKLRVAHNDYRHTELEGAEIGTVFDTRGTDLRLELRHASTASIEGAFGLQLKRIDFAAIGDEAFVPASDTRQLSLFAFEEWTLGRGWVLQASGRAERQDLKSPGLPAHDDTAFGASVGLIRNFSDELSIAANLAITERHPNATELYADGPHLAVQRFERGSVTQGNGLFDKEQSTNVDLTLRGGYERFEFTVTAFANVIDDYILLRPTAEVVDELQVFEFGQADVDLYGFEAELLVDLFATARGHLHARLFSDYVRGRVDAGGDLPRVPPLRVGAGVHYTGNRIDANLEATHYTDQDRVAAFELPTDAYTLVDAEFSYRFDAADLMLFARASNLTDQDARRHSSPLKDIAPLPGRSLQLGLRWDF